MSNNKPWKILVVDDDADVLITTRFALQDLWLQERRVDIVTANSAKVATEILEAEPDFAVILLDVVMEKPNAGLTLVGRIRHELGMTMTRIILRTGQAGSSSESAVVSKYEIDDYITKNKTEHERLRTAVLTAIRAFDQLSRLQRLTVAMEHIVQCTNELLRIEEVKPFVNACVRHIAPIMGEGVGGALAYTGISRHNGIMPAALISATSDHDDLAEDSPGGGAMEAACDDPSQCSPRQLILMAIRKQCDIKTPTDHYIYIHVSSTNEAVLWLNKPAGFDETDEKIIGYFANSVKVCIDRLIMLRDRMSEAMLSMGILAHEFRTPIATLRMGNHFVLESLARGDTCIGKKCGSVHRNAMVVLDRMSRHIDSSLHNAGVVLRDHVQFPLQPENICKLLSDTIEVNKLAWARVGQIQLSIEDECWASVQRDAFQQVIANLISNAAKALDARATVAVAPQISVFLKRQDDQIRLTIADRGIGIRAQALEHIFEPFYSSSGTPSHGLGLTMAKKAVEAMGGTITCTSEYGVGTTFEMLFAVAEPVPGRENAGSGGDGEGLTHEPELDHLLERRRPVQS